MRKLSLVFLIAFTASVVAAAEIRGTWSALVEGDHVQLSTRRNRSDWSRTLSRSEFDLTDAQIEAASETPVHFVMKRDAGTLDFSGTFQRGEGVGRFTFTSNTSYAAALRALGMASDEALDDEKLFSLATHDVSLAFIRDMQSLGYRENLARYIAFRIHGVSPQFVRELRSLGYDKLDADDLVRFRIHGVTPDFIRQLKELGYGVTAEDLVRFRIHGVSPEFIRELRGLGYSGVSSEELVRMRIHAVTPEFIRQLAAGGYHGIPVEKLIEMRIHGVNAEMLEQRQ